MTEWLSCLSSFVRWERHVLRLQAEDALGIEAKVARSAFLDLVWLESTGKTVTISPWLKAARDKRPKSEKLCLPWVNIPDDAESGRELDPGTSGVESLILLALDEPLPAADGANLFEGLKDQGNQLQEPDLAAWLINGEADRD